MLQGKVEKGTRLWKEWKKWEKKYIYIIVGTYAMTESQCSPQMPLSQTAQLVLWTLGPNILWLRQDQVTSSPSDVTCPLDSSVPTFDRKSSKESSNCVRRWSNSAKRSCCLHDRKRNARLQDNARHAKPGCCETTSSFVQWQVWKDPRNHMGHGAPSNMWLSQTARLVLWLVLSRGSRRQQVLWVR